MRIKNYLKAKLHFLTAIVLLIAVSSCGTSQYASQDNDGIYGNSETPVEQDGVAETTPNATNDLYYKNYFKEKSQDYDYVNEDDVVFTDIDEYEGTYNEEATSEETENGNYAGWGQNNDDITINVYSGYSGFGFNNWGYNPYNNWRFGNSWGYSGFYDPFWCPPFYGGWGYYSPYANYGYGYNNPYNNYGYGGRYYGRNTLAYNSGRRGSSYNRRSNLIRPNSILRNSSRTRTPIISNVRSTTRRPNTSTTRPTTTRTKPTTTRTKPSTTRTTTKPSTSRGRPANTTTRTRTNTPTRRSTPSVNRSSSSRGSTASPRSSSTRSSGSSSSPRRGRR